MISRIEHIEYIEKFCDNCGRPFVSTKYSENDLCIDCEGSRLLDKTVEIQAEELSSLRSELAAARVLISRAAVVMNDTGNDLNWPPEMPMAYAEMINELRKFSE